MESFTNTFYEGLNYVFNWPNYSFIVALIAIGVVATFKDWKKLALVSGLISLGFIIGFTAIAFKWFTVTQAVVGFCSAALLVILAILNFTARGKNFNMKMRLYLALLFGIVSGLAFKIPLLTNAFGGNLWADFPGFILGIAAGLLLCQLVILVVSWLVSEAFGMVKRDWILILSGAVIGVSSITLLESLF